MRTSLKKYFSNYEFCAFKIEVVAQNIETKKGMSIIMNNISFPNLGLDFSINPVAFTIFSKEIYWYGIIIAIGFLLSASYASKRASVFSLKSYQITDALLIAAPVAIICARLYYVAFSWDSYKDNLIDIIKIWEGGIAIYGGILGGALGFFIYAKYKKVSFLSLLDIGACSVLLGQGIGRWGNFVNGEAFGSETNSLFAMTINGSLGHHPTFLYESMWNLLGFIVLYYISKYFYKFKGQMVLCYALWYGFGRGIIEGLRTDSLYWGTFRVSQVLGFVSALISLVLLVIFLKKHSKNSLKGE